MLCSILIDALLPFIRRLRLHVFLHPAPPVLPASRPVVLRFNAALRCAVGGKARALQAAAAREQQRALPPSSGARGVAATACIQHACAEIEGTNVHGSPLCGRVPPADPLPAGAPLQGQGNISPESSASTGHPSVTSVAGASSGGADAGPSCAAGSLSFLDFADCLVDEQTGGCAALLLVLMSKPSPSFHRDVYVALCWVAGGVAWTVELSGTLASFMERCLGASTAQCAVHTLWGLIFLLWTPCPAAHATKQKSTCDTFCLCSEQTLYAASAFTSWLVMCTVRPLSPSVSLSPLCPGAVLPQYALDGTHLHPSYLPLFSSALNRAAAPD